jgi:pimeloyl-ACP methyl ester carboxylesterase
MQLALAARHRVRSLALLCTSSRGSDATGLTLPMFWLRLRTGARTRQMHGGSFHQIIMPHHPGSGQGRDIIVERFKSLFGYPFATSHCVVMRQLRALKRFDASARLQELAGIPTMVLSATEGRIFPPRYGRQLAASIPNAHYVEIPGSSHAVTIQSDEAVTHD